MRDPLYIIGAGGHAKSVAEIAFAANINLKAFISQDPLTVELLGLPVLRELPQLQSASPFKIAIAIGNNYQRQMAFDQLKELFTIDFFPALIHPSASVAVHSSIGFGTTLHQNATVGSDSHVGNFCTLNTGSNTDHDCHLSDFSSLGPGANLGGSVTLGSRAVVAIGSTVRHGITIATDSILGAASYAHTSTQANTISIGSPAHKIRDRRPGDKYL